MRIIIKEMVLINADMIAGAVRAGRLEKEYGRLYLSRSKHQPERYLAALERFGQEFGWGGDLRLFSAPGRTEIGGNHTDHNRGRVLAASVNLDVIAVVRPAGGNLIRILSEGHQINEVDLSCLDALPEEREHSNALIRGICARFAQLGYPIGGFDAYTTSDVFSGSGLSSSAAFEVLVCRILAGLFGGSPSALEMAQISQYAENEYFGKPCGLMDQTACSVGGFVAIDFADPQNPLVEKVDYDLESGGCRLCITASGDSHANLSGAYAAIPADMRQSAQALGASFLRQTEEKDFYDGLGRLRATIPDRALLRAMHFYADNERVLRQTQALKKGDFPEFLQLVMQSGHSSFMYLQNVAVPGSPSQPLALALALSQHLLAGRGAFRVHGGGFAGTIQAFVPEDMLSRYVNGMESVFGKDSCHILSIRPEGALELTDKITEEPMHG